MTKTKCRSCRNGWTYIEDHRTCNKCNGRGEIDECLHTGQCIWIECPKCNGMGYKIIKRKVLCEYCKGSTYINY